MKQMLMQMFQYLRNNSKVGQITRVKAKLASWAAETDKTNGKLYRAQVMSASLLP